MNYLLRSGLLLCAVFGIYSQSTIPCEFEDANGNVYDLTPLMNNQTDYYVDVPTGTDPQTVQGYRITLNVCRSIFLQACNAEAGPNCDACQQWPLDPPNRFTHENALGTTTSTTFGDAMDTTGKNGEGVTMYFGGFQSMMSINFICHPYAGRGKPEYVEKPTSTYYLLQWKSIYACAVDGSYGDLIA